MTHIVPIDITKMVIPVAAALTKAQAINDLDQAIKQHLSAIVHNVLTVALNDEQMTVAIRQYTKGLHHSRIFHDRAVKVIENEFKDEL